MDLIAQARKYEQNGQIDFPNDFMHHLSVGIALLGMDKKYSSVKTELVQASDCLGDFSLSLLSNIGKVRCWHFRRKRHRQFAVEIAQLVGKLKQAAS